MKRAVLILLAAGCSTPAPPSGRPGTISGKVVAAEGPLPYVFVYVKRGLEGRRFEVPREPVVLDQRGNEFVPRVFGIRAGQTLQVISSDAGQHNVFCTPFNNSSFNETLLQDQSLTRVFNAPEIMILFKCNLHASMTAWAGVVEHPYFAVTEFDGLFEIRDLPPGDYEIEAWNEFKGSKRVKVSAGAPPIEIRY